ncbi:fatty acid desaturase [Parvularcula sp. IMCC14364]|uniref:fatty acid desaturase family protein n=1 Tax=Parvularcula sp. IMCC14364 TaxID=3067902 RepID=UPI00274168EC|nr:fatty acid desaturase [Parvularcula sp. IMCC14364]
MLGIKTLDLNLFEQGDAKRQANLIAARYMTRGGIDWTSLVNGGAAFLAFAGIFFWGASSDALWLKLCLGIVLQTWLGFVCFNITHELAHGIVFKGQRSYRFLNHTIGSLIGLVTLTPYHGFRITHLAHHQNVNDPKEDPNYWVLRGHILHVVFKLVFGMFYDHAAMVRYGIEKRRTDILLFFAGFWVAVLALATLLASFFGWQNVFLLWLIPAYLSFSLVFMAVAVIPHRQSPDAPQEQIMHILILPGAAQAISTFLHAGHNYHLLHHAFPRVPSHHYASMARELFALQESGVNSAAGELAAEAC